MIIYPPEWNNYMKPNRLMTFRIDTPPDIIKRAKEINAIWLRDTGTPYFYFEGEQEGPVTDYSPKPAGPQMQKLVNELLAFCDEIVKKYNDNSSDDEDDE